MLTLNIISLASFAFKCGVSFIGGRSAESVLTGHAGELVFFFKPAYFGTLFFQWVRCNFNSSEYKETTLQYKGNSYSAIFLLIPQKINSKFLYSFKSFVPKSINLITFF